MMQSSDQKKGSKGLNVIVLLIGLVGIGFFGLFLYKSYGEKYMGGAEGFNSVIEIKNKEEGQNNLVD